MKENSCKGCKREYSRNTNVIVKFCCACKRGMNDGKGTDYYEKKVLEE